MSNVEYIIVFLTLTFISVEVKGEIASWFTSGHHTSHHTQDKNGSVTPLHEILNVTAKGEVNPKATVDPNARVDVKRLVDANVNVKVKRLVDATVNVKVKRAAEAVSGSVASAQGFGSPPPPVPPAGYPGGYPPVGGYPYPPIGGGFFPGFGGGAGAGLNLGLDAGIGGGILGGIFPYFPIIEKVIVIVGGGILILIFLAIIQALLVKKGILFDGFLPGFGADASAAKSFAGAVDVDAGPLHLSKSASGSVAFDQNAHLTQRVMNGVNQRW